MRLLFATHRAHVPDATGGAPQSMHELLTRAASWHDCTAVCDLGRSLRRHAFGVARLATRRRVCCWPDRRAGYVAARTFSHLLPQVLQRLVTREQIDVIVLDAGRSELLAAACDTGCPVLVRVVDTLAPLDAQLAGGHQAAVFANSHYVAAWLARQGIAASDVVYPIVEQARYRVDARGRCITFINPRPVKGLDLALAVAARLPRHRFLFVESWPLPAAARRALRQRLADVPNVTLARACRDMRRVYAQTRVLMVPSQCDEAFGRVVIEAHASGIPVVARAAGGLPEAVGAGGVVLAPDATLDAWVSQIERLADDDHWHGAVSAAARDNAARVDLSPDRIAAQFLRLVERFRA